MTDRELLLERLERLAIVLDELMPQCAELVRNAIALLEEQEEEISFLKAMQFQTVKGMDERELGEIVGKTLGLWR